MSSRRSVGTDAIKYSLLVFTEGEATENEYLTHYKRLQRQTTTVEIDDFHGTPLALVKQAAETKRRNERQAKRKGRAHDEVWCVFDVDEHPDLADALCQAHDNGIKVAISSPCIELWFLLHFCDQTAHIHRHKAQRRAKEFGCEKRLDKKVLVRLQAGFTEAKRRAQQLDTKHEGDGSPQYENPSSNVWEIIDSIARIV